MTDRPLDERPSTPEGGEGPTRDIRLALLPPPPYHAPDDEPTDRLPPPDAPARQATVAFDAPATAGPVPGPQPPAPAPPSSRPAEHGRTWPWVLLVLLPLLVIAVAGVVLALLLGGG
jgi:hypothetical protein